MTPALIKVFIEYVFILVVTSVNTIMKIDELFQMRSDIEERLRAGIFERDMYRWEDLNFKCEMENVVNVDLDKWIDQYSSTGLSPSKIIVDGTNLDWVNPVNDYPFSFAYLPKDILRNKHIIEECKHNIPTTHFNFMAGNYHTARFILLEKFWKNNLLNEMLWTSYRPSSEEENFDVDFIKFIKQNTPRTFKTDQFYNLYPEDLGLGTTEQRFINDFNNADTWIYENSLISVVVDTFSGIPYGSRAKVQTGRYTTPKSFKAIRQKRPFIITIGRTGGDLQALKNLGFETFSSVWDENYDEQDYDKRLDYISDLCYNLSKENVTNLYNKTRDICEHNYNVLMNTDWVQWYFDLLDKQNE